MQAAWVLAPMWRHRLGRRLPGPPPAPGLRRRQGPRSGRRPAPAHRWHRRHPVGRRGAPWVAIVALAARPSSPVATLALAALGARRIDVTWFGKAGTFGLMVAFPLFLVGHSTAGWHRPRRKSAPGSRPSRTRLRALRARRSTSRWPRRRWPRAARPLRRGRPVKAVIMAGGEGTRLRPLTSNMPKPMMPLANRPMMEHIVRLLREHGFDRHRGHPGLPAAGDPHVLRRRRPSSACACATPPRRRRSAPRVRCATP